VADNNSSSETGISQEQQTRIARYLNEVRQEKYQNLKTVRERFLRLHNRLPSREEESLHIQKTMGEDVRAEEPGLEEPPIAPEDFLPLGAIAKLTGTAAVGGAALLSQMMKKGPVKAKGVAKKEGGWIGSRRSKGRDVTSMRKAIDLRKANVPEDRVFKETGWFEITPGQPRYLDLDFVDEIAKTGELPTKRTGIFTHELDSPSFLKHANRPPKIVELSEKEYIKRGKSPRIQGTYYASKNMMHIKEGMLKKDPRSVKAHESAHSIQIQQGNPSGTSSSTIAKDYKVPIETARDIYKYSYGEVEARATQYYQSAAKRLLSAGKSPQEVKDILGKVHPLRILKAGEKNFDPKKIWTEIRDVNPQEFAMSSEVIDFGTHKQTDARRCEQSC